jgi:hypothetical protein
LGRTAKDTSRSIADNAKKPKAKKDKEFVCYACKEIFPIGEKYEDWGHTYCKSCARVIQKEKERTEDINETPFGTEKFRNNSIYKDNCDYETIREVVDYIISLFNLNQKEHYPNLVREMKQLVNDYNCSPHGVYLTLKYYVKILENPIPIDPQNLTGLVAYYYGQATHMWRQQSYLEGKADELVSNKIPVVNVYVSRTARKKYNSYFDQKWRCYENMISLDSLELDENESGT